MKLNFKSKIYFLDKLKMHHITVFAGELQQIANDRDKSIYNQRFLVTLNKEIQWRGGSVSLGNNSSYIVVSKERMKKLGIDRGDEVLVTLEKDTSEYGLDVPEEFTELLLQDDEARNRFEDLSMGFRRSIIYMVIQFKTSDKRIEKSIFFLENLKKSPNGKTTMRHIIGKEIG